MSLRRGEMIEVTEFTCPKCGGHTFGSTLTPAGLERMCHGTKASGEGCRFEWNQSEDRRYFRGTGRFMPAAVEGKAP